MSAKKFSPLARRIGIALEANAIDVKEADEILRLIMLAEEHRDQKQGKDMPPRTHTGFAGGRSPGSFYEWGWEADAEAAKAAEEALAKQCKRASDMPWPPEHHHGDKVAGR